MISDRTLQLESHELNSKDKPLLITALEKMNHGVIILEAVKGEFNKFVDFKFYYLNNSAQVLLRIKKQDIEGKTLTGYYPKLKNSDFLKKCLDVYENNLTVENEFVSSPFSRIITP